MIRVTNYYLVTRNRFNLGLYEAKNFETNCRSGDSYNSIYQQRQSAVFGATRAQAGNDRLISEVTVLRTKLIAAIKERDRKTLDEIYADDFTHTHASGQLDDKTKRITALVSGEQTIESAKVNEIKIRIYGQNVAVAIGQSTITDAQQIATKYRWTTVYVKSKNRWRIVASQATRLP